MKIKISPSMDSIGGIEHKLLRMSKKTREAYGFDLGDFVSAGNLVLQVAYAYFPDCFDSAGYVTTNVFSEIQVEIEPTIVEDITMGCDPEFFILDTTTKHLKNPALYFKKWNKIGYDGLLGEFRPQPHSNPDQVVSYLRDMIMQAKEVVSKNTAENVSLFAASSGYNLTAGFHCHMGIPKKFLNKRRLNYKSIISFLVKALDYHVGTLSVIPEGDKDNKRRCMPFVSYGKVSDHRIDNRTLEYRVPGGILLKNPVLSSGLLNLCKLVSTDALSKVLQLEESYPNKVFDTKDLLKEIYPYVPSTKGLYQLVCTPTTTAAEQEVTTIMTKLEDMYNYVEHAKAVKEYLYCMGQYDNAQDIYINWK